MAPLGHGKRDGARRIQVIRKADDAVDGGRVRSEAKLNEALVEYILYSKPHDGNRTKKGRPGRVGLGVV